MALADRLKNRFAGVHNEEPARRVMTKPLPGGQAWPGDHFGDPIADVKTVVIHETSGWPARNRLETFVVRYLLPAAAGTEEAENRGVGPQYYVSSDGTASRLIDLPLLTWHSTWLNGQSLAIENGHRLNLNPIKPLAVILERWRPLSDLPEDAPGMKFFALRHRFEAPHEVVFSWFPTAGFAGPKGSAGVQEGMLFPEPQFRTLVKLSKYLAERSLIPRNFPLFPWQRREENVDVPNDPLNRIPPPFRAIAFADETFPMIVSRIGEGFTEAMFEPGNEQALRARYHAVISAVGAHPAIPAFNLRANRNKRLNRAWMKMFHVFRGFHGHGFAGAITRHDDHTGCPGPLFDWHRFAREMWDYWWYPFDFDAAFTTTNVPRRAYASARLETPLIEYFYENVPTDGRPDPYQGRLAAQPLASSSPSSFLLDPGTPVYAMANGVLVAARLIKPPEAGASMSFLLVRHEVWHEPDLTGSQALLADLLGQPAPPDPQMLGRIDYNQEPTIVFSLVMHLGGTDQMSFDAIVPGNPDWLNRALLRKKECDLAITDAGALNAQLQGIPAADFTQPEPPGANRPTSIQLLRMDKARLAAFFASLRSGDVAIAPPQISGWDPFPPTLTITVTLGDFLGTAGNIRVVNGVATSGIHVEVFSNARIPFFTEVADQTSWAPPAGVAHPTIRYASEWAEPAGGAESALFELMGVDAVRMKDWWGAVVHSQMLDLQIPANGGLAADGVVYHYDPRDFMRWINDVTWTSEWPKFRVPDEHGAPAPRPARPRSRRV